MADRLSHHSPEWQKRQDRWRHNSYRGHVAMMKSNLFAIAKSPTTTDEAKRCALHILGEVERLGALVRKRVD